MKAYQIKKSEIYYASQRGRDLYGYLEAKIFDRLKDAKSYCEGYQAQRIERLEDADGKRISRHTVMEVAL
jgi:hypothetical protein